jgi:SOS-response transcriptional repressor LexA
MRGLTEPQEAVLDFIALHQGKGHTPTVREIQVSQGYASHHAAYAVLKALERKGFISRPKDRQRSQQRGIILNDRKKVMQAQFVQAEGATA